MVTKQQRIGIDMISGDLGNPLSFTIPGAKRAQKKIPEAKFVLAGPEKQLRQEFGNSVEYINCNQTHDNKGNIIDLEGKLVKDASRRAMYNPDAAIPKLMKELSKGTIDGVFSSGNTRILIANTHKNIGKIEGIYQTPLMVLLPTKTDQPVVLLDVGANFEATPFQLYQYAIMGSVFYELVLGIRNPTVMLLNPGEERNKGTKLMQDAYALLKSQPSINFQGFIEAKKGVYLGKANVVVTDGSHGNLFIKASEGVMTDLASYTLRQELESEPISQIIAGLLKKRIKRYFTRVYQRLSPDKYNSALLSGFLKEVFKGHSTFNRFAFAHGIENSVNYLKKNIPATVAEHFRNQQGITELVKQYHEPYINNGRKIVRQFEDKLYNTGNFSDTQIKEASSVLSEIYKRK